MRHFPPPRPNTADQACDDFLAFIDIMNSGSDISAAANADYEAFLRSGEPIFDSAPDEKTSRECGCFKFTFTFNKSLARHLRA